MLLLDMLLALLLTLGIVALIAPTRRYAHDDGFIVLTFFVALLFPLIWTGGAWLTPIGPPIAGIAWANYLLVGVFLALLILALAPPSSPPKRGSDIVPENAEQEARAGTVIAFGLFFWLLLIASIVSLVAYYT